MEQNGGIFMLGIIFFVAMLVIELGFMTYSLYTRSYQKGKKSILRLASFLIIVLLTLFGILHWSFRWYVLFLILMIKAAMGSFYLIRKSVKKDRPYLKRRIILGTIGNLFLLTLALLPAIIFPQQRPISPDGSYEVNTVSYTLTDPNRVETFTETGKPRSVTIQFWYPKNATGQYPLTIFSHGAFGFRGSNTSTFEKLASNGYVVCSIDHTYHSFLTKQTDGKTIIVNQQFINDAMAAQNGTLTEKETYDLSHEWLKLRLADANFVLDDILSKTSKSDSDPVYHLIDRDKIGFFGHSLGGATAAELGRERSDIDAVIVIDGSMLGEEIDFRDGKTIVRDTPYPIPILNMYNEAHYKEALKYADEYANMVVTKGAADSKQVMIKGSGHLNFTGLPLFSPFLASLLGTGEVDPRYCIETMDQIILDYFNYYLKGAKELKLQSEY
jgi:dienelactone hydrolase/multisubunit Na+/H+ antiporter MnhG subunit